ncbi:hypothetical protein C479_00370 [Halovivax asiaticus JCM 14624]|uniref:Uncharacterized protein n=1 Tax=Halovivax asiaticus JCM 14624 TaxID=1227490 RepID=M0BTF5_9EURY|nr:hypothetical protein [Halovivax asiaticus]ELZ14316.1 hypothetical protein C479_00370 [Halovivax asiaticus JCM 14624]
MTDATGASDPSTNDSSTANASAADTSTADPAPPFSTRLYRVVVSIVLLVPLTVFLGYGGWIVLTITATLLGYDPATDDGDRLRDRLAHWPEQNREVMRTDGRVALPWRP